MATVWSLTLQTLAHFLNMFAEQCQGQFGLQLVAVKLLS